MHKYNNNKAVEKLTELMKKRDKKLMLIAREALWDDTRTMLPVKDLVDIISDNSMTDGQMQYYFGAGLLRMPSDVTELHLRRCEDSGVVECSCFETNKVPEAILL